MGFGVLDYAYGLQLQHGLPPESRTSCGESNLIKSTELSLEQYPL